MRLLTVLINNRVDHIVNFDAAGNKGPHSYIVENVAGLRKLFSFYRPGKTSLDEMIYQTTAGEESLFLTGLAVNPIKSTELLDTIDMELYFLGNTKGAVPEGFVNTIAPGYWDSEASSVLFNAAAGKCYCINVRFNIPSADFTNIDSQEFVVNVAPRENIFDMVLDYGSEASQMLIHNRESDAINLANIVPLFDLFKSSLDPDSDIANSEYLQFDEDNDSFYKSAFFANKTPNITTIPGPYCHIADNNNNNVVLLSPVAELDRIRHNFITIPNIKVAGHGGVKIPTIQINRVPTNMFTYGHNFFYRSIVNSFLFQALRVINPEMDDKPRYLNINMLMPNVYTQKGITDNLAQAAGDIMKMVEVVPEYSFLKGVEVTSVSESDASFLGFMSQLPPQRRRTMPEGKYLIMDAGKGTLDFSVLEFRPHDERNMYNSLFRSGIIGSGNAITYSFVLAILKDIHMKFWPSGNQALIESNIAGFIKNKISTGDADEAELSTLIRLLEKYKILYNQGTLSRPDDIAYPVNLTNLQSIDDMNLSALNNCISAFIDREFKVSDESYIVNMIDRLAYGAAMKLKNSYGYDNKTGAINYIVFAGRGFQMKLLEQRIIHYLATVNPEICSELRKIQLAVDDVESRATYKNICLFCLGPLLAGRYNGRIIGIPRVQRHRGDADQYTVVTDTVILEPKRKKVGETLKKVGKFLEKMGVGGIGGADIVLSGGDINDSNIEMVKGFAVNYSTASDQTVFSGFAYDLPAGITPGFEAEIFFNGSDFEIRQGGNNAFFNGLVRLDAEHVFESAFPYCSAENGRPVPFPKPVAMPAAHTNGNTANSASTADNMANLQVTPSERGDDNEILGKYEE